MLKATKMIKSVSLMTRRNLINSHNRSLYMNLQNYMFKRFSQSSASVGRLKSIDDLPGDYQLNEPEQLRLFTDSINIFNEKYEIAKQYDPQSPMCKINTIGAPSVILFSHDMVKQYQQYELNGQTKRTFPPIFMQLVGKVASDAYGRVHLDWRKKAIKSFKPHIIDQYTPFIQQSANDIVLSNIAEQSQKTGDYAYFCEFAKRFAFEIGSKFIMGPLLDADERETLFQMYQTWAKGFNASSLFEDPTDPNSNLYKAFIAKDQMNEFLAVKFSEAEELVMNDEWKDVYGDEECVLTGLLQNDAIFDNNGEYGMYNKMEFMVGLLQAAHDTTANSMTNLVYAISKHPEQTDKMRKVIMNHPELGNPESVFSMEMLNSCAELDHFVDETQRMYSIIPFITRMVHDENGLDFGGYLVPKDTAFTIPIRWLHQGEGSWTESMEFKPERFDKSNGKTKEERGDIGRYNNIPFATGLHKCLGMHLAKLELKIYTTLLLRDWQFEIDEEKLKDEKEAFNEMNVSNGLPHYNAYLKMRRREH